jgi:hypothetical protein
MVRRGLPGHLSELGRDTGEYQLAKRPKRKTNYAGKDQDED